MATHLFTYGSLMFAPVWSRLVSGSYRSQAARLPGFARRAVRGETYPVVFPQQAAEVDGLVYFNVSAKDLARLDAFEGDYYQRQTVTLVLDDATEISTHTYVLKPAFKRIASNKPWSPEQFQREGLRRFMARYAGF